VTGLLSIDGERRQLVAEGLWRAWRDEGRRASLLIGFSGVGKTERVITPLLARAREEKILAIHIDVPAYPIDLDRELVSRLSEALNDVAEQSLAAEVAAAPNLGAALRHVLGKGGLVVIDEFQRLLQPRSSVPVEPFSDQLAKLARRNADGGCLWLVSNRSVDTVWTEPLHVAILEAPTETRDAIRIVLESIGTGDAEDRLPEKRHDEVARRFGGNPRALRLLGHMLRSYDIEELIGAPRAVPEGVSQEELANDIERSLLAKAREGLSNAASDLLRDLAILTDFAPIDLIQAVGGHLGDVGPLLVEMQQRFLIEQRQALRQIHPVAREVELPRLSRDSEAYRAANLSAGKWYAGRFVTTANSAHNDVSLARNLSGAHYYLLAAGAHAELRAALEVIRPDLERRFNWTGSSLPSSATERDAQISLLEIFLETPGTPSVEYHLARLLRARGEGDDLARALGHSESACTGQEDATPWVLRLQLTHLIQGPAAAVELGRMAAEKVDPAKSLVSVYQILGAALNHVGRDSEAVEVCLGGAERSLSRRFRLVEQAASIAAAMPDDVMIQRVDAWSSEQSEFEPQRALMAVLFHERADDWRGGADRARIARRLHPAYLHLAVHEAFCWLGAGEQNEAQSAFDAFPRAWRFEARSAAIWLAAFIALRCGEIKRAQELTATYIGGPAPATRAAIEGMLLREWDTRVATLSEPNPALVFPILPPSLSGLPAPVFRPQHGPPVLPQNAMGAKSREDEAGGRLRVLAIGTEWLSGQGGLSTFNRQLCCALAGVGMDVVCVVISATAAEIEEAGKSGVRLVSAPPTPGVDPREWLARPPAELGEGYEPDFIIGHGRITGPAALRLEEDHFPTAKRLHFVHMAPDEIEWHKLDREIPAGLLAEDRTNQELELGRKAYRVVAVGPRLQKRYARDLEPSGAPVPIHFDPGFDAVEGPERGPPRGEPWKVLLLGRAEDYRLKGIDLAARALGRAANARANAWPEIEFVVRGAQPKDVDLLRAQIVDWADSPRLQVVVRAYTADEDRLDHDLRTSSLVLMPSRREGFGLVGLEAIVAGTPVLVSSRSGLAQLLKETLDLQQAARVITETTGDEARPEPDLQEWERAIDGILRDREAAFRRAVELRDILGARHTWRTSVESLFSEL